MKFLSAVLLFSTLLASPLYGQHSYFDFEKGLKLSEVQRTAVEDIKRKYMDEWRASGREVIKKRLELRDLYRNPSLNRDEQFRKGSKKKKKKKKHTKSTNKIAKKRKKKLK